MSTEKNIKIPELSLVVLIGATGSGKSSFARKHFKATEIVSSDTCRGLVSDDENSQAASSDAFALARYIAGIRLKNGLLTVIDATNVQDGARKEWVDLAREYHCLPVAIILNMPEKVCAQRNALRDDRRNMGAHVIPQHISQLKRSFKKLKYEGFRQIIELRSPEEVEAISGIVRDPLYNNKKQEHGPFDIIGDIHGCYDELVALLAKLGYADNGTAWAHPEGRKAVFVGDLVDRGPKTPEVLKLVMAMTAAGNAFCAPGNHDVKLMRWLGGKNVQAKHGLQESIDQLSVETPEFREEARKFIDGLVSHFVFDDGKLVVSHAGLKESMQGRGSGAVREFCLYGETTGETDEFGLPVRLNWAAEYKGKAMVVYGHTPVPQAQWLNNTIDIDTGCVFGGSLTALRYPERELVAVKAAKVYCEPTRPLDHGTMADQLTIQQQNDDILDIADFAGKQIVETRLANNITIREENAIAAIEVMSRFAVNPKWLIYLPPTMSPSKTSILDNYLEFPTEAFEYYKAAGINRVVCEEKHMGSRAVVIVGRDEEAISKAFGITNEGSGTIYTRTGRAFFNDKPTEQALLQRLNAALVNSGFYDAFDTDWVCLDTELMPWSAKAQALLQTQYASVGTAAKHALSEVEAALKQLTGRDPNGAALLAEYSSRADEVERFGNAYRQYCWPVNSLDDYKLAPFHILATEGKTWTGANHEWHMEQIKKVCAADPAILLSTTYHIVDLDNEDSINQATEWWLGLTDKGGEGMVVKPYNFIERDGKGLIQPAIKIRGREYLRIIYGPEYTAEENLSRLKMRGLNAKRGMAMREFALGIEGLQRFADKEPLRRVHQCVFGVLAMESEPVDPRL